jgi:AcrR family transcriptional regulator
MQPAARTPGKGERSRRELTEIAINCFARFGFQGTSIDRIARDAGVTKGAIYYHFKDKDDLLGAAVADRIQAFEDRVQRACEGIDASRALRRIAEVCVEHAQSLDHPRFVIKLMAESSIPTTRSPQLREMVRQFRAFLRNLIRQAQERGEFRTGSTPRPWRRVRARCSAGSSFTRTSGSASWTIRLFLDKRSPISNGGIGKDVTR